MCRGTVKSLLRGLSAAIIGLCCVSTAARADGPEIGVNVGAVVPLSKYKRTIDDDLGGGGGLEGG